MVPVHSVVGPSFFRIFLKEASVRYFFSLHRKNGLHSTLWVMFLCIDQWIGVPFRIYHQIAASILDFRSMLRFQAWLRLEICWLNSANSVTQRQTRYQFLWLCIHHMIFIHFLHSGDCFFSRDATVGVGLFDVHSRRGLVLNHRSTRHSMMQSNLWKERGNCIRH